MGLRKCRRGQAGFTLVELLVVVVILGILSAVVVFAVRGSGDRGKEAAVATDQRIVRTALEVYCAQKGSYPVDPDGPDKDATDTLHDEGFLSSPSKYNTVATGNSPEYQEGNCPGPGPNKYKLDCRELNCGLPLPPDGVPDPVGSREGRWQAGAAPRLLGGKAGSDDTQFQEDHIMLDGTVAECGLQCGMILSIAPAPPGLVVGPVVQLYDPKDGVNGRWIPVPGAPSLSYKGPKPALLKGSFEECGVNCGKVLVHFVESEGADSWHLYDPRTGNWTPAGRPNYQQRWNPPAAELLTGGPDKCGKQCGKVLVRGGGPSENFLNGFDSYYSAELYDPVTNTWALTSPCLNPLEKCRPLPMQDGSGAVRLPDGRVATGGLIYDPKAGSTGTWTRIEGNGGPAASFVGAMVLPINGWVLTGDSFFNPETMSFSNAGGCPGCPSALVAQPQKGQECLTASLPKALASNRVILGDGTVLASFGSDRCYSGWSFVFDPSAEFSSRWRRIDNRPARGANGDGGGRLTRIRGTLSQCGQTCGKVLAAGQKEWSLYSAPPEVTGFSPTTGLGSGGTEVTLRGSSLASASSVTFLGASRALQCSATSAECHPDPLAPDSKLIVVTPPHAPGVVNVVVTTKPDQNTLQMISGKSPANQFTFSAG